MLKCHYETQHYNMTTDDLTQDWKNLSLADTAPLLIFSRDENEGKKLNRKYFYFKLTLLHKGKIYLRKTLQKANFP